MKAEKGPSQDGMWKSARRPENERPLAGLLLLERFTAELSSSDHPVLLTQGLS